MNKLELNKYYSFVIGGHVPKKIIKSLNFCPFIANIDEITKIPLFPKKKIMCRLSMDVLGLMYRDCHYDVSKL